MKYGIVAQDSLADLAQEVNERIVEGWKPLGGIAIARRGEDEYFTAYKYCQAMILDSPCN